MVVCVMCVSHLVFVSSVWVQSITQPNNAVVVVCHVVRTPMQREIKSRFPLKISSGQKNSPNRLFAHQVNRYYIIVQLQQTCVLCRPLFLRKGSEEGQSRVTSSSGYIGLATSRHLEISCLVFASDFKTLISASSNYCYVKTSHHFVQHAVVTKKSQKW